MSEDRPQTIYEALELVFLEHMKRYSQMPDAFRNIGIDSINQAINYWINNQFKRLDTEKPRQIPIIDKKEGQRWVTPYNERLTHNLNLFLKLKLHDQEHILAAAEDRIFWNGDYWTDKEPLKLFNDIIRETQKMREIGVEQYKTESIAKMKQMLNKKNE